MTLKACLTQELISNARLVYEAVACNADSCEKLEQWFDYCRNGTLKKTNRYMQGYIFRQNNVFYLNGLHAASTAAAFIKENGYKDQTELQTPLLAMNERTER